jgi:alpha-galactosidase
MKKYRDLLQIDGDFYRLINPFEKGDAAWIVVSQDKTEAVAAFYQRLNKINGSWLKLKLEGLDGDKLYEVSCHTVSEPELKSYKAYGDELMNIGIVIDRGTLDNEGGDFASLLFTIKESI